MVRMALPWPTPHRLFFGCKVESTFCTCIIPESCELTPCTQSPLRGWRLWLSSNSGGLSSIEERSLQWWVPWKLTLGSSKDIQIISSTKMKGKLSPLEGKYCTSILGSCQIDTTSILCVKVIEEDRLFCSFCWIVTEGMQTTRKSSREQDLQRMMTSSKSFNYDTLASECVCNLLDIRRRLKRPSQIKKIIFRILQLFIIMHHDAIWHHFEIDDLWDCAPCLKTFFFTSLLRSSQTRH